MRSVLLIFAKYPVKGNVKTRIASELGDDFAYNLSNFCISEVVEKIKGIEQDIYFVVDSEEEARLFKDKFGINSIILGVLSSLSEKFDFAFRETFSLGYDKVVLIPADIPFISSGHIEDAFEGLDFINYVFGPENNGGVYLMGMKNPYENIFEKVRWSTEHSFRDLLKNVEGKAEVLEFMDDLNTVSDVVRHSEILLNRDSEIFGFLRNIEVKNESS